MAHELSLMADGTYSMARADDTEISWHGLENVVPSSAPFEVWLDKSGMDFKIERSVVCFNDAEGIVHPMNDKHVLYRSDTKAPLSTVSAAYNIVQPMEVLDFFTDLCAKNQLKMDTAGVIRNGTKFWALARTGAYAQVSANDRVMQYILMATSADASMATTIKHTSVRVVCSNTLHMSLGNKESAIRVSHSSLFDADDVKMDLGLLEREFDAFEDNAQEMHKHQVTTAEARRWYAEMLSGKSEMDLDEVNRYANESRLFKNMWEGYTSGKGAEESLWGLLNGVTWTVDHMRGRSNDTRLDSQLFGTGAALKAKAFKLAMESL
jgi:phage/plasmid-like protein (TIGR03299 family)